MSKLKPREITVGSEAKFFGFDKGMSSGSQLSVLFVIPEDMTSGELNRAVLEEKEQLDIKLLVMELGKGAIDNNQYDVFKGRIKAYYDRILKRVTHGPSPGQPNPSPDGESSKAAG